MIVLAAKAVLGVATMKKLVIGLSIAALLLMFVAVAGWYLLIREQPLLDAELSVPLQVKVGEAFEMVVETSNPHSRQVSLDSIDIDHTLLQGFQVLAVEPSQHQTENLPFLDQRSWIFEQWVSPGDEYDVTFKLKPLEAGHFTGNVDVCNSNYDWKSLYADIVVEDE